MTDIKIRLERCAAVLGVIDQRRLQTGDPNLGAGLEHFILERELKALAAESMVPVGRAAKSRRQVL